MFGIIKCCSDYKALELKLPGAGCRSAEEGGLLRDPVPEIAHDGGRALSEHRGPRHPEHVALQLQTPDLGQVPCNMVQLELVLLHHYSLILYLALGELTR